MKKFGLWIQQHPMFAWVVLVTLTTLIGGGILYVRDTLAKNNVRIEVCIANDKAQDTKDIQHEKEMEVMQQAIGKIELRTTYIEKDLDELKNKQEFIRQNMATSKDIDRVLKAVESTEDK